MLDTFARILKPREHYAAHGINSSIVVRNEYEGSGKEAKKETTIELRRGREEENEAVQVSLQVLTVYDSGRRSTAYASVAFTQEVWDAIVEHVKKNRNIDR